MIGRRQFLRRAAGALTVGTAAAFGLSGETADTYTTRLDAKDGARCRVWLNGTEVSARCAALEVNVRTGEGRVRLYDNVNEGGGIQQPLTQSWHSGNVKVARFS